MFTSVNSIAQGLGKLEARLDIVDSQYFPPITLAQRNAMVTNTVISGNHLRQMLVRVKQVLNGGGVSRALYIAYCAFGSEMLRAAARSSGESLAIEAQTLIQKWVARGLSQTVLEKCRTDVFNIGAPTP